MSGVADDDNVRVLKQKVAHLEAENSRLREQLSLLMARGTPPSRSYEATVREQRHNFFNYSNTRRY